MPSFADLKAKTAKATSTGVGKLQNVRDRNTSVPMKKTNWDPYNGAPPPPPPPPRINPNSKPSAPPPPFLPPPSRTGSTSIASRSAAGSASPSPASLSRASSTAPPPPLPGRGGASGSTPPPPLPRRNNTLSPPPPLPNRSSSVSPASFSSVAPSPRPPPRRSPESDSASAPPPSINKSTKPTPSQTTSQGHPKPLSVPPLTKAKPEPELGEEFETGIDWTNLSEEDKQVFFSWLDEFFSRLLGIEVGPSKGTDSAHKATVLPSSGPPPAIR